MQRDFSQKYFPARLIAARRLVLAALVAFNLAAIGLAAWSIVQTHRIAVDTAKTHTANLATAVERDIAGLLSRIDLALLSVVDELAGQTGAKRDMARRLDAYLARHAARLPETVGLRFVDAEGRVVLTGERAAERLDVAETDHFRQVRAEDGAGPIIGDPIRVGNDPRWALPVARRVTDANGKFAGMVCALISLDRLAADFARMEVGRHGGVALRDGEMGLILRVPELEGVGARIGDRTISQTAKDLAAARTHAASYTATTPADGRTRAVSLHRVENQALYVAVTLAEEEYLAGWRTQALRTAGLTFAVVVLSLFAGALLLRSWRRGMAEVANLVESQQLLRTVAENAHDWVYWRSADGGSFHYIAPACETISGYAVAEFEADPGLLDRIVHPDDRARWDAHRHDRTNGPLHVNEEYRILTRTGEVRWINHSCREILAPDGASLGRCGTNQDITTHKRAAEALADSEALLRAIVDNEPECVKVVAPDGTLLQMNPAGLAMAEAERPEEVIGRPILDIVAPEHREAFRVLHEKVCAGGAGTLEFEIVGLRGGRRWLETHAVPMRDAAGNIAGHLAVTRDITRRRTAESTLRENMRRTRALIDASDESMLLLEPDGKLLAINQAGARRFAATPERMVGTNFFDYLPAELAARRRETLLLAAESGEPVRTRDQRGALSFENTVYPVRDDAGGVEAVAVYAKDVTERQRDEKIDALFHRADAMLLRWQMNAPTIAQMVCEGLLPIFGLGAAWVGRAEKNSELRMLAVVAKEGDPSGFIAHMRNDCQRWRGGVGECLSVQRVMTQGRASVFALGDGDCPACAQVARQEDIAAAMLIPLTLRGETWGVLALYGADTGQFEAPAIAARLASIAGRFATEIEAALQQEWLTLLETALAASSNAAFITEADGRILWVNRAFTALSGFAAEELVGMTPGVLNSGAHDAAFFRDFWETLRSGATWQGEIVNARRDGSRYTVSQTVTPLRDGDGKISHYVAILEDITARKAAEARVEHLANYDMLTDLPNRNLFFDRLGRALALARRDRNAGALLFLDLDRFKAVNDTHGHEAGDRLLRTVAARCQEAVRESDTVARLAGDEFTVLLPHVAGPDDAARVAEKIIASLGQPVDIGGPMVEIGVSIGIALFPQQGDTTEAVLGAADSAMYAAKRAGRHTYRFFAAESV